MASLDGLSEEIKSSNAKVKNALSLRLCTMSQINKNNGQIEQIALWIALPPTV